MTKKEYDELLNFFSGFDLNKDGYLDRQEVITLGSTKEQLIKEEEQPSDDEIDEFMQLADKNRDGLLDLSEFIALGFLNVENEIENEDKHKQK